MRAISILLMLAGGALAINASVAASDDADVKRVHGALAEHIPALQLEQVRTSPIPGLFEVDFGDGVAYSTADGKYLIRGDLYLTATRTNLTESGRNGLRREALAKLDEQQMIVFSPPQPKHTITVFTDVDCGYCRKLHQQIEQYNALGIAVRYLAFPRSGPNTDSWKKMEAVWCSKDRRDAITRAKLGEQIAMPASCGETPVAAQYALGAQFRLGGTPMIILNDGGVIGGYMPPQQLAQQLDAAESQKTANMPNMPNMH